MNVDICGCESRNCLHVQTRPQSNGKATQLMHNFRHQAFVYRTVGALLLASLSLSAVEASTLFVSPVGQAGANGTAAAPLGSLTEAAERAQPGDVILVAGGTYKLEESVRL